jgi:hypothetical protein
MRQAGRRCAKPGEDHLAVRFAACDQNGCGHLWPRAFGRRPPQCLRWRPISQPFFLSSNVRQLCVTSLDCGFSRSVAG